MLNDYFAIVFGRNKNQDLPNDEKRDMNRLTICQDQVSEVMAKLDIKVNGSGKNWKFDSQGMLKNT